MDHQAKCAFIISQAACMNAELAAMQARNHTSQLVGRKPFHEPGEFEALPDRYGLGHNTVLSYLAE